LNACVVDPDIGVTLDVPSVGQWITVTNGKMSKELSKELVAECNDPCAAVADAKCAEPAELLHRVAATVDNLSRLVGGVRAFIRPSERPLLPSISRAKLAAVPIHPIDKDVLARQVSMEGMMDMTGKPKDGQPPDGNHGHHDHHGPHGPHGDGGHDRGGMNAKRGRK
jgi:hypothetical protein